MYFITYKGRDFNIYGIFKQIPLYGEGTITTQKGRPVQAAWFICICFSALLSLVSPDYRRVIYPLLAGDQDHFGELVSAGGLDLEDIIALHKAAYG